MGKNNNSGNLGRMDPSEWEEDERWAMWMEDPRKSSGKTGAHASPSSHSHLSWERAALGGSQHHFGGRSTEPCHREGDPFCYLFGDDTGRPKITLGGASQGGSGISKSLDVDLLLDLKASANSFTPARGPGFGGDMEWANAHWPRTGAKMCILWADGGAPPMDGQFFVDLIDWFEKSLVEQGRDEGHVVFSCIGGHGRTGTALAAVLIGVLNWSAEEAICYVREKYCDRTIETSAQVNWLAKFAGKGEKLDMPRADWPEYWTSKNPRPPKKSNPESNPVAGKSDNSKRKM